MSWKYFIFIRKIAFIWSIKILMSRYQVHVSVFARMCAYVYTHVWNVILVQADNLLHQLFKFLCINSIQQCTVEKQYRLMVKNTGSRLRLPWVSLGITVCLVCELCVSHLAFPSLGFFICKICMVTALTLRGQLWGINQIIYRRCFEQYLVFSKYQLSLELLNRQTKFNKLNEGAMQNNANGNIPLLNMLLRIYVCSICSPTERTLKELIRRKRKKRDNVRWVRITGF